MTKTQKLFAPGTRVEVFKRDFSVGPNVPVPQVWMPAVVTSTEPMNEKLIYVFVTFEDGHKSAEIVGPRGGNKNIRLVS
jgi:hypothetical protein